MTVGKYVIDPAVLAHLSDVVPYARRGRALALTELSWSLAFILGVPAAGFLLGRFGTRAPFAVLTFLGLAGFVAVRIFREGRNGDPGRPAHPQPVKGPAIAPATRPCCALRPPWPGSPSSWP